MGKSNLLGKESLAEKMQKLKQEMDIKEPKTIVNLDNSINPVISHEQNKISPKLFVSGRLDRKKHTYVAKSLVLLIQLEDEIKTYCRGGDLAILNYLIREGLNKVKATNAPINVDIEEISSDIT